MRTVLYNRHCALGAKMVPFGAWEMPLRYKGIVAEHLAVRHAVGLFDVSHMGRIDVKGVDAESLLDELSTNLIRGKPDGSATYTVWCHESGGSVDDVLVYRESPTQFFIIVNAGNRERDLAHLLRYAQGRQVTIQDRYNEEGILALQGPFAEKLLSSFFPEVESLKRMHFLRVLDGEQGMIISRTGYTGAGGYELYAPNERIAAWWDRLLKEGKPFGIEPAGLGARDTLRLEMGFALYGHELSDSISPTESVAAWTVHEEKRFFLGKGALEKLEQSSDKRFAYGVELSEGGVAREGFPVFQDGLQIGSVTSGSFSPILNKAIALILVNVPLKMGDLVTIEIRKQKCPALIVSLPFITQHSAVSRKNL
jgi:aminomethyltransferase